MASCTKMKWIERFHPRTYVRTAQVCVLKDFLIFQSAHEPEVMYLPSTLGNLVRINDVNHAWLRWWGQSSRCREKEKVTKSSERVSSSTQIISSANMGSLLSHLFSHSPAIFHIRHPLEKGEATSKNYPRSTHTTFTLLVFASLLLLPMPAHSRFMTLLQATNLFITNLNFTILQLSIMCVLCC